MKYGTKSILPYSRKLNVCKSCSPLNCITFETALPSAIKCSTVSKPLMPSKLLSPHRLTFKYLTFKSQPKSRNDSNELPSKFNAIKLGKKMCIWCNPKTFGDTRIWMWVSVSKLVSGPHDFRWKISLQLALFFRCKFTKGEKFMCN